MDFWERLFARAGRRKPEPSAEAKCAEEWDTELASELSETEREQLKKAGCIRKHIYFSGRVQAVVQSTFPFPSLTLESWYSIFRLMDRWDEKEGCISAIITISG